MSAFVIDAFEFCRANGRREGVTPVAEMKRLAAECVASGGKSGDSPAGTVPGEIAWSLEGSLSKPHGYPQIVLSVAGPVQLQCQRCLAPFEYKIDSSTVLMLGKDDAEADEIEQIIDDESIDVIVGSRTCDIRDLIEDEALLALPQAPKHEVCPDTAALDALKADKPSPFDVLKGLKP